MSEDMGIQVAPQQEDEVIKLSSLFSRAANAIVKETELAKQVEGLQSQVNELSNKVQVSQDHSHALDSALNDMTRQRDEAITARVEAMHQAEQMRQELQRVQHEISLLKTENADLDTALTNAKKDRDDYGMKTLELEHQVSEWKHKAEQARNHINNMMSLFKQAEPVSAPPVQPEQPQEVAATNPSTDGQPSGEATSTSSASANPAGDLATPTPHTEGNAPWWQNP